MATVSSSAAAEALSVPAVVPHGGMSSVRALLRKLAQKELELVESCHSLGGVSGEARALVHHLAGIGQVHVFDLDSASRTLGGTPVGYFGCTTNGARSTAKLITSLLSDYTRALRRHDLTGPLRDLFASCIEDYRALSRSSWASEQFLALSL